MVQIIPRQPTNIERFMNSFQNLSSGLGEGAETLKGAMDERKTRQELASQFGEKFKNIRNPDVQKLMLMAELEQQKVTREREKKSQALEDLKSTPYWKNASDLEKAVLEREILGDLSAQTSKSLVNLERERKAYDILSGLQGDEGMPPSESTAPSFGAEPGEEPRETKPSKRGQPKSDIEEQINKWRQVAANPNKDIRDFANKKIEDLRKEQEFEFKKGEAGLKHLEHRAQMEYQEAKPTIEHANNLALSLPNQLQDLEGLEQALKSKDFGFFSRDNLAEMSGVEAFRSPEGAQFKSSIKNYFLGDVKGVGGKGLNQWLEKQLNDAMLKIGRDNAANETVLAGFKAKYDRDQMWLDEYRKLYKQQKESQGFVEGDIGQQVAEKVKPYFEARQKQLEAEIKAIQKSGQALSGKMLDVIGPDGEEYEIDESQVGDLPEGYRLK